MKRTFNIADPRLLEHTGVVLEASNEDLPQFTAFDPDLDEAFVSALSAAYVTTLEEGGDDAARGKLGEKTQALLNAIKYCGKVVKNLRYWVKKTYEDNPAKRKRFRLRRFWKVRDTQAELVTYMAALASTVAELRPELEEANAPADLLDSVKTGSEELTRANTVQENSKGARGTATHERIIRLNKIHSLVKKLSDAAEYVFEDNPAKRELYRIPGNSQPSTFDEEDDQDDPDSE